MNIALFGGTFNPIHRSHTYVMEEALSKLDIDKLLVIPTFVPPHKVAPDLASPQDRLQMCRLATINYPKLEVCNYEILQQGASYTYKTLAWAKESFNPDTIFLIMGSDMFLTIEEWKNPKEIYSLSTIVVIVRQEDERHRVKQYAEYLGHNGVKTFVLDSKSRPMSSTQIRSLIKNHKPVADYLVADVIDYIKANRLYL